MPDNNIANQNTTPPTVTPAVPAPPTILATPSIPVVDPSRVGTQAEADSPWNEPLPKETPNPQVSGTLSGSQPIAAPPTGAPSGPIQPFDLPQNVEKTMPPVVKAVDLVTPVSSQNMPTRSTDSTGSPQASLRAGPVDSISSLNPAFNYNYDQNQKNSIPPSGTAPAVNSPQVPPAPVVKPIDSVSGVAALVTNPASQIPPSSQPVNADILPPPPSAAVGTPSGPTFTVQSPSQPINPLPAPAVAPSPPTPQPPVQPQPVLPQDERSFVVPDLPATTQDASTVVPEKRSGLSKLFAGLKHKSPKGASSELGPKEAAGTAETLVPLESPTNSDRKSKKAIIYILIAIVVVLGILITLTEAGILSIGLEKVYGSVSLEKLWSGLPKNSETAIAESLVTMKDHQKFKVSGTINLNIDKTIKNEVTTPLVSAADSVTQLAVLPIKAILTAYTTPTDSSAVTSTDTTDTTDTTSIESSTATTDSNTATTDSSTATTDSSATTPVDQSTESAFVDTTTTKMINATVAGSFGDVGNDFEITIVKPIGSETINLKNSQSMLWVKGGNVKFDEKAEPEKWLLYNLATLSNDSVVSQTLAVNSGKGFSAGGTRQANEKVGSVRCYKYSLDSVELGNSLSGIGVLSDSIQNISGTVWIGIKDKLIRRIDLKITTSPSSPVIQINLSLNLSDYDTDNNFAAPASIDIIDTTAPAQN
ncbi:MAG: hypothetical protein Q7S80_02190 [bacterium]|nr:hypothetical protein [bacterium]